MGFGDNNIQAPSDTTGHPITVGYRYATALGPPGFKLPWYEIDIPLNSAGQIFMYTQLANNCTATLSSVYISVVGYYMGD
jgi:hypothetical protein